MKIPYNSFFKQGYIDAPLIVCCGPNEALIRQSIKKLVKNYTNEEITTRTFSNLEPIPWLDVIEEMQTFSLFKQKNRLIIKLAKASLDKSSGEYLLKAMSLADANKQLIITCSPLKKSDEKNAWYQYAEKNGLIVTFPELSLNALSAWTKAKLAQQQNTITDDALSFILNHTEGNLDALIQELDKINISYQNTHLEQAVLEKDFLSQSQYTLYQWLEACLNQDIERSTQIFRQLTSLADEKTLLLWGITKEIQTLVQLHSLSSHMSDIKACQQLKIWQSKIPLYQKALRLHDKSSLRLLQKATYFCDNRIKGISKLSALELLEQMGLFLATKSPHLENLLQQQVAL